MASPLILIANPGSASRKYALFEGSHERASLHFEYFAGRVICAYTDHEKSERPAVEFSDITEATSHVMTHLRQFNAISEGEHIERIGLRIVAPGGYFLHDHLVDDDMVNRIRHINRQAPIHISATLNELEQLRAQFPHTPVVGVSDSAFHITKPDHAWNYGIPLEDADRFDIKRFGYHGLSVESVVEQLKTVDQLPERFIIVHLGSGASVTAIQNGHSMDNTMGYSPLDGLIMATRAGGIDPAATQAIKDTFKYDDAQLNTYLNLHSGLLGLGGNSDIRELLRREESGDKRAQLALSTYVYNVQKGIGQMAAALGGIEGIVFTGTVGERSGQIRHRILEKLNYLDILLDENKNTDHTDVKQPTIISSNRSIHPIYIIPAHENAQIAEHTHSYKI